MGEADGAGGAGGVYGAGGAGNKGGALGLPSMSRKINKKRRSDGEPEKQAK